MDDDPIPEPPDLIGMVKEATERGDLIYSPITDTYTSVSLKGDRVVSDVRNARWQYGLKLRGWELAKAKREGRL